MLTAIWSTLGVLSAFGIGMGLGFTPVLGTTLGLTLFGAASSLGVIGASALTGGILAAVVLLAVLITLLVIKGGQAHKTVQLNHPPQVSGAEPNPAASVVTQSYTPKKRADSTVSNATDPSADEYANMRSPSPTPSL